MLRGAFLRLWSHLNAIFFLVFGNNAIDLAQVDLLSSSLILSLLGAICNANTDLGAVCHIKPDGGAIYDGAYTADQRGHYQYDSDLDGIFYAYFDKALAANLEV